MDESNLLVQSYEVLELRVVLVPVDDLQTTRHHAMRLHCARDVCKSFYKALKEQLDGGMAIISWTTEGTQRHGPAE